jgi:hypothetical protein
LIFGLSGRDIFRRLSSDTDEAVMQGAYRLYRSIEKNASPKALRKRELLDQLRARAIRNASHIGV